MSAFIKENIICRFGIPKMILSDNRTLFINRHVGSLLDKYVVDHRTFSTCYQQGNGQTEAMNKTLIWILSKLLDERGGTWADHLLVALWAYQTSKRKSTCASPFSLVYEAEMACYPDMSMKYQNALSFIVSFDYASLQEVGCANSNSFILYYPVLLKNSNSRKELLSKDSHA
ncbi:hypothetical protein RHSIM_RhsimUnG0029300 [Rhododendron simsii]|uniref:Integrase catalytic domain-containing protein n=1 Tax=Rhododendron simsii TaxID=118357 RepID=A0A834FZE7_RHOSS|nr:hypothetical protein RHSIM_RhsimUnG0029300 [Rhododendron simsii]